MRHAILTIVFFCCHMIPSLAQTKDTGQVSKESRIHNRHEASKPYQHLRLVRKLRGGSRLYLLSDEEADETAVLLKRRGTLTFDTLDRFRGEFVFDHDFLNHTVYYINGYPTPGSRIGPVQYGVAFDKRSATVTLRDSEYLSCAVSKPDGEEVILRGKSVIQIFSNSDGKTESYTIDPNWDRLWSITVHRRNIVVRYTSTGDDPDEKYAKKLVLNRMSLAK